MPRLVGRPRSRQREATGKVAPKPVTAHKIVGQSTPRLDIPGKVTGRISYVQDICEAGMVHGRVVRPPRYGSTLESVDEAAVKAMPGVIEVVRDGSFLGVVAEREEQAIKAREALVKAAKWKLGPELPDPANIHAHLKSLPSKDSVHRRQAGAGARGRQRAHARGDLHQAVSVAWLDRAVLRGGDVPQRPDDRVDPFAGRVPARATSWSRR